MSQSEREPSLGKILEAFERGPRKEKGKQEPSEAVLSGPERLLREILEAFKRGPKPKEKDKQVPSKEALSSPPAT